ncbi:MAG: transposase [Xanthomonadaceae bacterium]|nr:transposase [Xanthomonadaceae bacterium]
MPRVLKPDESTQNILIRPLGPALEKIDAMKRMTYLPPLPKDIQDLSQIERLHRVFSIRDLHIPMEEEAKLQQTIDMLIRQSLSKRDPTLALTWREMLADSDSPSGMQEASVCQARPISNAMAAVVSGIAGCGKTEGVRRSLLCLPGQVIRHHQFPNLVDGNYQVVWVSIDAPGSGRAEDLAEALMVELDDVMSAAIEGYTPRFSDTLARSRRDGSKMLAEWRRVAQSHFLALLHIDEVQNLFKLATIKIRSKKNAKASDLKLTIAEDSTLKWILTLINRWGISVIFSGTPDGIGALTTRLSTGQRLSVGGYHAIHPFAGPDDLAYRQFIDVLARYQWMVGRLPPNELYEPIFRLTAGVRRLIIALWVAAHRVALSRTGDELRVSDFEYAASTFLAPAKTGIEALLSRSPSQFGRFVDLRVDEVFWSTFWSEMGLGQVKPAK